MRKTPKPTRPAFKRSIFRTGDYISHFNPDDRKNPFIKLYDQKKKDTIQIIEKSRAAKTVLDVGGGMGRISLRLTQSPQNAVVLMDISVHMLKLAAKAAGRKNNLHIVNADAHHLPFKNNAFDHVVGLDLFCHLAHPRKALAEFHRILRHQGLLILDSTNSNPLWALFYPRYLGKNPLNWVRVMRFKGVYPGWQNIVNHFPKKVFLSFLADIGFSVVRCLHYGPTLCPKWHLAISRKETPPNLHP